MIVYTVIRWHRPTVAHGCELQAIFSTREKAQAFADHWNAHYGVTPMPDDQKGGYYANDDEHEVEEWVVDEYTPVEGQR